MKKFKINKKAKHVMKKIAKWLFFLLALIFIILVIIACYLLIADYFYDGRFD